MARKTRFVENLHYVPDAGWRSGAFTVLRAGKVEAGSGHVVRRADHVGQDILFCLSGKGVVETEGHRIEIEPGQVAWIANERPHAHIADDLHPWTLLWFRFDGPEPAALRAKIFSDRLPRTPLGKRGDLAAWFDRLFSVLRSRDPFLDLRLNQLLGEFFLILAEAQAGATSERAANPLAALVAAVRADIRRPWSTRDLAERCRLGVSQTRRLFRKQLNESPRRWLIRERLIAAQGLMMRDDASLAHIAEACGFCDVYHFGREFKRVVGQPPALWRRMELGLRPLDHRPAAKSGAPAV